MSMVAPDCAAALQFAQGLCELGRFGEAAGVARRVIAIEPHNAFAWCVMAQGQLGQGQDNAALLAAQAAISQTSDAEWALRLASAALSRLGRSSDAEAAAERAREIRGDRPETPAVYGVLTPAAAETPPPADAPRATHAHNLIIRAVRRLHAADGSEERQQPTRLHPSA